MSFQDSQAALIPYRAIASFADSKPPVFYSLRNHSYLACSTHTSFKIYRLPKLEVLLVGPSVCPQVTSIQCLNEEIYITSSDSVFVFNYNHLVSQKTIPALKQPKRGAITCALLLGGAYVLGTTEPFLRVFENKGKRGIEEYTETQLAFSPWTLVHPQTYLNKVIVVGEHQIQMWNIKTCQLIYDFTKCLESFLAKASIKVFVMSGVVDVAAIGLSDGNIFGLNLKTTEILFKQKQSNEVTSIGFSRNSFSEPLLLAGDSQGAINIWDLNKGGLVEKLDAAHNGRIASINFMMLGDTEYLVTTSESDNSVKLWVREETNNYSFRVLRHRQGAQKPLTRIRFYGDDGFHLIGSTECPKGELIDFSTINESFTTPFSQVTQIQSFPTPLKSLHCFKGSRKTPKGWLQIT